MQGFYSFVAELKRRKVFRVGTVYLVGAWGAALGASELLPTFGVSDAIVQWVVIALFMGLPVALVLAWVFEVRVDGVYRDPRDMLSDSDETAFDQPPEELRAYWKDDKQMRTDLFRKDFLIGRDAECDLRMDSEMVSRRHARVLAHRGRWHVEDLGSRNGTRLNGELVRKMTEVPLSSELQLFESGPVIRMEYGTANLAETVVTPPRPPAAEAAAKSDSGSADKLATGSPSTD